MTFIPFPDGAQVCVRFEVAGRPISICIHFEGNTTPTPSDFQQLADDAAAEWESALLPEQSVSLSLVGTTVYDLSSSSAPVYTFDYATPPTGGNSGPIAALNMAFLMSHRTGERGRTARGRTYIPGLPESTGSAVTWDAGKVTAMAAAWFTFISLVEAGSNWTFVVASRQENGVPRTTGLMRPVTTSIAQTDIGTRRLRLGNDFATT